MDTQLLNDLFDKQMLYLADQTFTVKINGKEIVHLNSSYDLFNGDEIKEKYIRDTNYQTRRKYVEIK